MCASVLIDEDTFARGTALWTDNPTLFNDILIHDSMRDDFNKNCPVSVFYQKFHGFMP